MKGVWYLLSLHYPLTKARGWSPMASVLCKTAFFFFVQVRLLGPPLAKIDQRVMEIYIPKGTSLFSLLEAPSSSWMLSKVLVLPMHGRCAAFQDKSRIHQNMASSQCRIQWRIQEEEILRNICFPLLRAQRWLQSSFLGKRIRLS